MRLPAVNNQLMLVFSVNFVTLSIGMGLFPVLPLYATDLGASTTLVGIYLGLTYASITFGTLVFGWLAVRFPHRWILAAAGLAGMVALMLMGQVTSVWQLILLTGIVWFAGGISLSLGSVLTGMLADKTHRGKSFSLMSLSMPLGALAGGAAVSQLIAWKGYPLLFVALGTSWVTIPLAAWKLEDCTLAGKRLAGSDSDRLTRMSGAFYAFALVTLLSTVATNIGRLGTSLAMHSLVFSASDVASTATFSGLVAVPVVLLIGPLSDRLPRRHVLAFTYGLVLCGALTLVAATQLWQFWLAATLLLVGRVVNSALGAALVTDFLRPEELIRGLSRLNTVGWSGGVAAFTIGGFLFARLGAAPVFVAAAVSAAVAAVQLEWVGRDFVPRDMVRHTVDEVKRITQTHLPVRANPKTKS
jgi:MFS family permease